MIDVKVTDMDLLSKARLAFLFQVGEAQYEKTCSHSSSRKEAAKRCVPLMTAQGPKISILWHFRL